MSSPPLLIAWRVGPADPSAVAYDDAARAVVVGHPGGLARLAADGTVLADAWGPPLPRPLAVRVARNHVAVCCPDELVVLDAKTGDVTRRAGVPGAVAVAADSAGTLYAADPAGNRVFAVDGGGVSVFAEGPELEHPAGLFTMGNQLFVAGRGTPEVPGRVFALNLKTRQKTPVTPLPVGRLAGLDRDERCNFLVADPAAGVVFLVSPRGEVALLLAGVPGAAGVAFVPDRRLLLVPRPDGVTAYDLTKLRK